MDEYEIGDLVWAKMKGFSPWPGRVTAPKNFLKKPNLKTDMLCIFFFGTHNYAFIEKTNIKPYQENKVKFEKLCKSASFKEAIEDIETYVRKKEEDPAYNPEDHIKATTSNDEDSADLDEGEEEEEQEEEEVDDEDDDDEPKQKKRRKSSNLIKIKPPTKGDSTPSIEKNGPAIPKDKDTPQITKMESRKKSDGAKPKREPTSYILGFLGLGRMGKHIVSNLVKTGHKVNIWNRTVEKADALKTELEAEHPGLVQVLATPSDVAQNSDIIFSCVTDFTSVKNLWYGKAGLNQVESFDSKGYVELTNIGTDQSTETNKLITNKGGKYLEAQLQGGAENAAVGKLVLLVAGNEKLYDDCTTCFEAIGKTIFYLGKVGSACKMNLILQVMRGISMCAVQESFALATKCGLSPKDVQQIFNITSINAPFFSEVVNRIVNDDPEIEHTMQNVRTDIKMALDFSDVLKQPLAMAAAANESIIKQLNS